MFRFRDKKQIHQVASMVGRVNVTSDGSLVINPVKSEDAETYVCEVSNGIGKRQRASASLEVACRNTNRVFRGTKP